MSTDTLEVIGKTFASMKVLKCKYEWKILNFLSYTFKDCAYRSENFYLSDSILFFMLKPYSYGYKNLVLEYSPSLYLCRVPCADAVTASIKLGIKTLNGILVNEREIIHSFTNENPEYEWRHFFDISKLKKNKSIMVPSDVMTVVCSIEVKNAPALNSRYCQLSRDLINLLFSKENTDVTLNISNSAYLAHKTILGARSRVFAAMFRNEMEEKKTGVVHIPDCDPDAFYVFLIYLYSGSIDFSKCNICELYKIAEKYDVLELKPMCREFLVKNLSVENFCDIFIMSEQYSDETLVTEVLRFFERNFEKIVHSEYWELFLEKNFRPANKLLKAISSKFRCN